MKISLFTTIALFFILPALAFADVWFPTGSPTDLTPVVATWGLKVPGIPGGAGCLQRDGFGVVSSIGSNCSSGSSPGGASTNIQYNNSGTFGGDSHFTWDAANGWFSIGTSTTATTTILESNNSSFSQLVFTDAPSHYVKADGLSSYINFQTSSGKGSDYIAISGTASSTGGGPAPNILLEADPTNSEMTIESGTSKSIDLNTNGASLFQTSGTLELELNNNTLGGAFLDTSALTSNATAQFPVGISGTTDTFCFQTLANCSGSSFGYPFPNNSTSTLLNFNGGLTAYASSTIGAGGRTTGLTISGGATTTGNAYFGSNVGIGTTTPGSLFSINNIANFTAATSTLYGTGGINLTGGCFAISANCLSLANLPGVVTVPQGGTGKSSLTGSQVVYGNGTGNVGTAATSSLSAGSGIAISNSGTSFVIGPSSPSFSLAAINAGVLGSVTSATVPTSQPTSTLYGAASTGGFVLQWSNITNGLVLAATSSSSGGSGTSINTNPISVGFVVASSTATSTFSGGIEAPLIGAAQFAATSSTATSTFAGGLNVLAINETGNATSTYNNGITISSGCFAKNEVCISTPKLAYIFSSSTPSTVNKPVKITFTGAANSAPSFTVAAAPTLVLASNVSYINIEIDGAGGAGDGTDNTAGAGGGYSEKLYASLGSTYFYDIGKGSTGDGANTAFGTGLATTTANGGQAGTASGPGLGGGSSNGDVMITGSSGESTNAVNGSSGGTGARGGGGAQAGTTNAGSAFGGGGATTGAMNSGGNGGPGGIIISIYI